MEILHYITRHGAEKCRNFMLCMIFSRLCVFVGYYYTIITCNYNYGADVKKMQLYVQNPINLHGLVLS